MLGGMTVFRSLLRVGYAPVFFVLFVTAALALVDFGLSTLWLLPMLVLAIALALLAEHCAPYREAWNQAQGDVPRDFTHAIVNEGASVLSVAAMPGLLALLPALKLWPHKWPLVLQLLLAVLVTDIGVTLVHMLSHRRPLLWRFHAVHHSVTRMYGFNGLMKHPLHLALETAAGVSPLVVVGMPVHVAALLGYVVGIQLLLQHSNVDMRLGLLARVWAVAPGHRHHHLAHEARGNVNFGLFTTLCDHLFGTFVMERLPEEATLGVAGRPDFPRSYVQQLMEPFRRPSSRGHERDSKA